jgi:RimJ/RimL family protein N-acetyltransferase
MSAEPFWMNPKEVTLKDGTKVVLMPEKESHRELAWEMFSTLSDESHEFLPIPITRERLDGWFDDIDYKKSLPILGFVQEDGITRLITSSTLSFHEMELYKHRATFGITVHDDYQGRGLGTLLTQYMIEIARSLGLKKVDLMVVTHNHGAIHVYEKCGFKIEGHLKMNHYNRILNEYCDEYQMGLVLD